MKWMKKKIDPRYLVLLFLSSFVVMGQQFLGFFQQWDQMATSVISACVTEVVLNRVARRKWQFPLSALITGLGVGLLLSSHLIWPYAVTSILAIGSKFALRIGGKHLFNPNNAALCFMLLLLPQYAVSTPKQWTNGYEVMVIILLLGVLAAYAADRLDTVLSFMAGFALLAFARVELLGEPFFFAFGPMLGASFQLFVFFMITDPVTTPPTRTARILFALSIALLDAGFRAAEITNSTFYSAFLVALCIGIPYRLIRKRKMASYEAKGV